MGDRAYTFLPVAVVARVVKMLTDPGELVVEPHLGGGTTAVACWQAQRRLIAGDVNPAALRFSGARLLDEHAWPSERTLTLFAA